MIVSGSDPAASARGLTPLEAFQALLLESIPTRPSRPDPLTSHLGPTAQFQQLLAQRELWAQASTDGLGTGQQHGGKGVTVDLTDFEEAG